MNDFRRFIIIKKKYPLKQKMASYCLPNNTTCWPSQLDWDMFNLTINGGLAKIDPPVAIEQCLDTFLDGTLAASTANGACMAHQECFLEYCELTRLLPEEEETRILEEKSTLFSYDLPEYSVMAKEQSDVVNAILFANKFNIPVSIKSSGHNYAGSSTSKGSLLIWMYHYDFPPTISTSFQDTCETEFDASITLAGGTPWGLAYKAVYEDGRFDILGGGSVNVGCCGGWLGGGGLTTMSRFRGLGVDNVLQYEVVLASGEVVIADTCSNTDLFWALRGGGGGTYGVVTKVVYKLYPQMPMVQLFLALEDRSDHIESSKKFVEAWVDIVDPPNLDKNWGGYWSMNCAHGGVMCLNFKFYGSRQDAEDTLISKIEDWVKENKEFSIFVFEFEGGYLESYQSPQECPDNHCGSKTACELFGGITADYTGNRPTYTRPVTWLIPESFYDDPESAKQIYIGSMATNWDVFGGLGDGYILGGAINDVGTDDTSVHPALRMAANSVIGVAGTDGEFSMHGIDYLKQKIPDSAPCFNHDGEPWKLGSISEWQEAYWGDNLARLQQIKSAIDPDGRFNAFQSVGYKSIKDYNVDIEEPITLGESRVSAKCMNSAGSTNSISLSVLAAFCTLATLVFAS